MAELAPFVHKFRATGDAWSNGPNAKVIKRNRLPLSCEPCRERKLKCNRQKPCEMCMKRNAESSCTYSTKASQKQDAKPQTSRAKAQDRLRQLEELVMQMVDANQQPSNGNALTPVSDPDSPAEGVLSQKGENTKYVGSTHWSAILENIADLKATLSDEPSSSIFIDTGEELNSADTDELFGPLHSSSLSEILAQHLPPRLKTDRLMSVYFNANYMTIPHIHSHQFQRQYEQFWANPSTVTPHWASMLFSICNLGESLSQVARRDSGQPIDPAEDHRDSFLSAAAQCIRLGGFRPCRFVIESLALYAQCRYNQSMDPSREVGLVFSILVRLAYRMAYHRDPDNFSHFTPFEAEMRRRVWAMTRQFDLMSSFQLGLPPNVAPDSWDTKLPRNLMDSDFHESSTHLPPSRPESQPTKILYFIVKARLMSNFSKICSHALSFRTSSPSEINELDASIRATYDGVPDTLRVRPMSQSFADPPYLIMVRINCEFLFQKSLVVLHRKYMTQGYENSTRACIAAAKAIVTCFADLHKEFKPGGQIHHERWMLGSFTMNDFLLAAMVLCLAVSQWRKRYPNKDPQADDEAGEWVTMLRTCYDICAEMAPSSNESRKVAEALGAMLVRLQPGVRLMEIPPSTIGSQSQSTSGKDGSAAPGSYDNDSPTPTRAYTSSSYDPSTMPDHSSSSDHASTAGSAPSFPLSTPAFFPTHLTATPTPDSSHQQRPQPISTAPQSYQQQQQPTPTSTFNVTNTINPFYPFLSTTEPPTDIDWTALDTFFVNGSTYSSPAAGAATHNSGMGTSSFEFGSGGIDAQLNDQPLAGNNGEAMDMRAHNTTGFTPECGAPGSQDLRGKDGEGEQAHEQGRGSMNDMHAEVGAHNLLLPFTGLLNFGSSS